jgi:hypothetical protein
MRASNVLFTLFAPLSIACGGQVSGAAPDAAADMTGGTADAAAECSAGTTGTAPSDGGARYSGGVVASWTGSGGVLSAGFPSFGIIPPTTEATCNCATGIALPAPSSNAGTITVQVAPCGPLLASLPFGVDSGAMEYPQAQASWTPGDALAVSAPGDPSQVHAFAGILQTGVPLTGLTPAIGPSSQNILVPRAQPFVVSRTPEGRSGEMVDLVLRQITPSTVVACGCVVPDSAGSVTVPAALLSEHFVPSTTKTHETAVVLRTIDRPVAADDALVDLVSLVEVQGTVLFQ